MTAFPSRPSEHSFPSDTYDLVDECIERVRAPAGLDEDAVLPPLPVAAPRREVVMLTRSALEGGARDAVAEAVADADADAAAPSSPSRGLASTHRVARPTARTSRLALALCALVALAAAGASVVSSPLGRKAPVVRVTQAARAVSARASAFGHAAVQSTAGLFPRP